MGYPSKQTPRDMRLKRNKQAAEKEAQAKKTIAAVSTHIKDKK